jgi:MoaA/NifB/PqqE/SkfB family radical SAM enzyme
MKLEDIGFYTLSDERAKNIGKKSPMWRCELIITDACNFKCPYCRGVREDARGTLSTDECKRIVGLWADDGLKNVRFSGGEPTIHKGLLEIVAYAKQRGVERIAISTNGSASLELYGKLIDAGVNDFSISLDSCCSAGVDAMSGTEGKFNDVIEAIKYCSSRVYTTVGIVVTEDNVDDLKNVVEFAHSLGVSDIRIISAAQYNRLLDGVKKISKEILDCHPILKYRVDRTLQGFNVRGIEDSDPIHCHIVQDDSVVVKDSHFPCVIYMREGGNPIGKVSYEMRKERIKWFMEHNCHEDPICKKNCLDVCIAMNKKCEACASNLL